MKLIDQRIQQILDNIETYQNIALEDYQVPPWQALPPASAPHLAFRPHCGQLGRIQDENGYTWLWDGEVIYQKPHLEDLVVSGVCVSGSHAVDVPKVPTDELWASFEQELTNAGQAVALIEASEEVIEVSEEIPSEQPQTVATTQQAADFGSSPLWLFMLLVVGATALGGLIYSLINRPAKSNSKSPQGQSKQPQESPKEAAEIEYDFEL